MSIKTWLSTSSSLLLLLLLLCVASAEENGCDAVQNGQFIFHQVTISTNCRVKADLTIAESGVMVVEPGVVMSFDPRVVLGVNGTLIAEGLPNKRIIFTKTQPQQQPPKWPDNIRLVDDYSVHQGRLEVLYKGDWRGVCSNNVNWTQTDTDVACKQLGFSSGNFTFGSWARNHTKHLLFHQPACKGNEDSILNCKGSRKVKVGKTVCSHQAVVHLYCRGSPAGVSDFWGGIEFYNTTIFKAATMFTNLNESTSILKYVDLFYAGLGKDGNALGALRADPHTPHLHHITIQHSLLDATNFTNIKSSLTVRNSSFINNRGHGLAVESHMGHVKLFDNVMEGNYGNGLKVKFLNGRYVVYDKQLTFCEMINLASQSYPLFILATPNLASSCSRKFETIYGHRLTVSVLEMDIEPGVEAWISVRDGTNEKSPLLARYAVVNNTLPMGVTSTYQDLFIQFDWKIPHDKDCITLKTCAKFAIIVDSTYERASSELLINNTRSDNNMQHGMFVENIRNSIIINASNVNNNHYGAGIAVYGGAGDILINSSNIEHNHDNGVNITVEGGWRIFNHTSFNYNLGNGLNITMNMTSVDNRTRYSRHQRTEVSRCSFIGNLGNGLNVGNYCSNALHVVNDSKFLDNSLEGLSFLSCLHPLYNNISNLTIGYNLFENNGRHAILLQPLVNVVGRIANNTFKNHNKQVLLVDNSDDFRRMMYLQSMPVKYEVEANTFFSNNGLYVVSLRLVQGSTLQQLTFRYNRLIDNIIMDGRQDERINKRSRSRAVLIVSSDNIKANRNLLQNPSSTFEVCTHLQDVGARVDVTANYWGTTDYDSIIQRIFDQGWRYNLARLSYHPALQHDWLYGPVLTDREIEVEVDFVRGNRLGGRLGGHFTIQPHSTYHVDRDININPHGRLIISEGSTLEFENSLGMVVQGQVEMKGTLDHPIHLKLKNQSTWINQTTIRLHGKTNEEGWMEENMMDGGIIEGWLEVWINETIRDADNDGQGTWGTICKECWSIRESSIACQMMGLIFHPQDNTPPPPSTPSPPSLPLISDVTCTDLDTDLLSCQYERMISCDKVVYLRCRKPAWSGVQISGKAMAGKLVHVWIEGAGLYDASIPSLTPALTIHYNIHQLNNLYINNNLHHGVQIFKNDPYTTSHLRNCIINNNMGDGVVVRSSFFEMKNCTINNNTNNAFLYDPSLTAYEALELRKGIHDYILFEKSFSKKVEDHSSVWVVSQQQFQYQNFIYTAQFTVSRQFRAVIDILDYNPDTKLEKVVVYDTRLEDITPNTRKWEVDEDLIDFPVLSQFSVLTVQWKVKGMTSGRFSFVLRSRPWQWDLVFPGLNLHNNTFQHNHRGVHLKLYNHPSDEFQTIFHRYNWEKVKLTENYMISNEREALLISSHTRHNPLYLPSPTQLQQSLRVAEISYLIDGCVVEGNGEGVKAHHPDVGFSNNVWIWEVYNNNIGSNKGGGLLLEFPRVNLMFTDLFNHSIDINNTNFHNNINFEMLVGGFYCNSSITNNIYKHNYCNRACVTLEGTEKNLEFVENHFEENYGRHMLEIKMNSHTPYTQWVEAAVNYNSFKNNYPPINANHKINDHTTTDHTTITTSTPSHTIAVRGLQNTTINRNILNNPHMHFELLAAQVSSRFENFLDVTENWWGSIDAREIEERIFDFDDWNNFAIAEYVPILSSSSFNAPLIDILKPSKVIDFNKALGGRVEEFVNLTRRQQPYYIDSDLTIMQGYSMLIQSGVQIRVKPGVGILVLGSLTAFGSPHQPISIQPAHPSIYHKLQRNKRSVTLPPPPPRDLYTGTQHQNVDKEKGFELRMVGGENGDGGFLEVYNNTEQRWSIVCDDAFNDRTAQVACRTMGKESSNPVVERSRYYGMFVLGYPKMHDQIIEWFWRDTTICEGDEKSLSDCRHKINYNLVTCMQQRRYIYLRCAPRNLDSELDYWGGIRFSNLAFDKRTTSQQSFLQHVDLIGAGILHTERIAAVQGVLKSVDCKHVRVHNSAWNAFDFIAPPGVITVADGSMHNNNGYAIGVVVLNGQSWEGDSMFTPLKHIELPPSLHGLISMCSVQKMLLVNNRALLYHKYSFETVDCIKVLRSKEPRKQIGIRFLHFHLFNDSTYVNSVEIFEGEFFSPEQHIVTLTYNSSLSQLKKLYKVSSYYDTISIRITASPAYGTYGFIAEVVTLPISPVHRSDYGNLRRHEISGNMMSNNLRGGVLYRNVGEDSPRVLVQRNHISMCGTKVLNNTETGSIDMFIQNTRLLTISNNFLNQNAGGIHINTSTKDQQSSLFANITNNLIMATSHSEALHLEGHYYQSFVVQNNHISDNHLAFRNVIGSYGVQMNFTSNVLTHNSAQCIINASVPEQIDINQRYSYNSIHHNHAKEYHRSTFFLKSAKFDLRHNFLLNPLNIFEVYTSNRTKHLDGMHLAIQATHNWWGNKYDVKGKIWDRWDDDHLIQVNFKPFLLSNTTLLDGKCYPGWHSYNRKCYMYFGSVVDFHQASLVCRKKRGRLAWARDSTGKEKYLGELVARQQFDYTVAWKVWVFSDQLSSSSSSCTFLRDFKVIEGPCSSLLPFICEKDPYIQPRMNWLPIIITTVISCLIIFFIIIPLIIFGCIKSSQRKTEKTDRKVTLQRSLAASRQSLDHLEPSYSAASNASLYRPLPNQRVLSSEDTLKIASHETPTIYKHPLSSTSPSDYDHKSKIWSDTSSFVSKASSRKPRPPLTNFPPTLENQIPLIRPRGTDYIRSGYGGDEGSFTNGYGDDGGYGGKNASRFKDGYGDDGGYGRGKEGEDERVRWRKGDRVRQEKRGLKYQIDQDDDDDEDEDGESRV